MNKPPEFALDYNMIPIYTSLYNRYPDGFPEILVFKTLPNESLILRCRFPDDRSVYFVKEDTNDKVLNLLFNEIDNPSCDTDTTIPITYHSLSDNAVSKWLMYACYISDCLKIDLRQICFTHKEGKAGYSSEFITFIDDDANDIEMLISIAHELRHAWQHIHYPEWFDEYVHPEENEQAYHMQVSEIDAEAFAIKVESIITGVEFINSYAGLDMDPMLRNAIILRMQEIDVVLSRKKIKSIQQLINLKGMFEDLS